MEKSYHFPHSGTMALQGRPASWSIAFAGIDLCVIDATPIEVINTCIRGISLDVSCYENNEQRIGMMV